MKTLKFRIYPDKKTISLLNSWFDQTRFVWNYYLNQRTITYKDTKKGLSYVDNAKDLTQLKKQVKIYCSFLRRSDRPFQLVE